MHIDLMILEPNSTISRPPDLTAKHFESVSYMQLFAKLVALERFLRRPRGHNLNNLDRTSLNDKFQMTGIMALYLLLEFRPLKTDVVRLS